MANEDLKYPFIDGLETFPENKDDDVREIKKWLEMQPHLPKLSYEFLHLFLHCNYYNLEETKTNIESYFTLRSSSPELFCNRSLFNPKVQNAMGFYLYGMVPKRTPEGYQVIFIGMTDKSTSTFNYVDCVNTWFTFFDVTISEFGLCPGYVVVFDAKNFSLPMFLKINFNSVLKVVKYFQDAAPVRVKNVVIINSVPFVDKLNTFCKPFLKSRLMDMIQVYGNDLTNFYKTVPRECAYEEFGGTCGSLKAANKDYFALIHTKYAEWIEEESIYAIDDSKKQPAPRKSLFSFW